MPPLTVWDHAARHSTRLGFFINIFGGHKSFLWGHWYPCIRFLVMSPLGYKARVGSLICTWWRHHRQMLYWLSYASSALKWNIRCFQSCLSVSQSLCQHVCSYRGGSPCDHYLHGTSPSPRPSPLLPSSCKDLPWTCSNLFTWDLTIQGLPRHVQTYSFEPYNAGTPKRHVRKGVVSLQLKGLLLQ